MWHFDLSVLHTFPRLAAGLKTAAHVPSVGLRFLIPKGDKWLYLCFLSCLELLEGLMHGTQICFTQFRIYSWWKNSGHWLKPLWDKWKTKQNKKNPSDAWDNRLWLIYAIDHLCSERKRQGENSFGKLGQSEMPVYIWGHLESHRNVCSRAGLMLGKDLGRHSTALEVKTNAVL